MVPHGQVPHPHVYEFGDFRLDTQNTTKHRLLLNGQPYKIQDKQFSLLCILIENRGRELSSEELIKLVWADRVVDDSNLQYYVANLYRQVSNLRSKIGKEKIANKKKEGYSFVAPVKVITLPPTPYPDLEFNRWMFFSRECWGIKVFLGAGVLLSLLYSIAYMVSRFVSSPALDWPDPRVVLCLIQFVVVFGALIASYFVFDRKVKDFPASPESDAALMKVSGYTETDKWREAKAGARSSLKKYSRYWKFLLVAWVGLYVLLIFAMHFLAQVEQVPVQDRPQVMNDPSHPLWSFSIASTIFNNFNSLALALCFVVLNYPTVFREGVENTSLNRRTKLLMGWGLLTIIVFTLVEFLLVHFPPPQWFPWMTQPNYVWALDLVSGIAGAITLALYVGRVQSKFLGPSTWLPLALYLYVAIQSLYVAILEGANWGAFIIEAALILKCLLYLYVAWLFKSGRLLFYLVRVKTIYVRVNIQWQEFLANLNGGQ